MDVVNLPSAAEAAWCATAATAWTGGVGIDVATRESEPYCCKQRATLAPAPPPRARPRAPAARLVTHRQPQGTQRIHETVPGIQRAPAVTVTFSWAAFSLTYFILYSYGCDYFSQNTL